MRTRPSLPKGPPPRPVPPSPPLRRFAEAQRIYTEVVTPLYDKVRDSLTPLIQVQIAQAKAEYETAVARSTLIRWLAVGSLAIFPVR